MIDTSMKLMTKKETGHMKIRIAANHIIKFIVMLVTLLSSSISPAAEDISRSNQIDPQKIKYISYMMASPKGAGQSSFGHSYLLFKSDDYASPNDQAIEFVASVDPSEINYLRGLGFFSYDRGVVLERFNVVKKDITIIQNRDLLIYDLKLSDDQKTKIISITNRILAVGKMGRYSFMSSNCADAVSSILRDVGIDIAGLSAKIPTHLRDRLDEEGLIIKTTNFESVENSRLSALKKYAASLDSIPLPKYYRKLDKMFEDATENQQLFNLLLAKQNKEASSRPRDVDAFINSYWLTLTGIMKKQFKSLIALPVGSVQLDVKYHQGRSFSDFKVRSSKIECTPSDCALNVTFSKNDEPDDFLSFKRPIKSLHVSGDEIFLGDLFVGVRLGSETPFSKDTTISFAVTPVVTKYYAEGRYIADIGFIVETNGASLLKKKTIAWNKEVISQTNTDPKYPMCFTILHLQQAMFERAIFAPELPQASNQKNISIIKDLLAGQVAVIPGFPNAYEFTKTFSHSNFIKEIYPLHQQNYNGLLNGMEQWFQMESLEPETLRAMAVVTHNLNISIPVIFRRDNNTTQTTSHSILITDMRDEGSYYSLSGYDPNFAHTNDFGTIDKNTLIMNTKTYGPVNLYIDKSNLNESLLNLQIINSPDVRELLIKQASQLKRYTFSSNEILMMQ